VFRNKEKKAFLAVSQSSNLHWTVILPHFPDISYVSLAQRFSKSYRASASFIQTAILFYCFCLSVTLWHCVWKWKRL